MFRLKPDEYYGSVLDIAPQHLVDEGRRAVLLDLDNTLWPRGADGVPADIRSWVSALGTAGLRPCILSNTAQERVRKAGDALGVPVVENALKPLVGGYRRACELLGVACDEAAMVGDQLHTDIIGANRAGLLSILVMPLCDNDLWHTRLLRGFDRLCLGHMQPRGHAYAERRGKEQDHAQSR